MFKGYKWDMQASEQGTISDQVLLISPEDLDFLKTHVVKLYNETIAMEGALKNNPALCLELGISQTMADALCTADYNPNQHIRFMRFDFHPTDKGWQISEVNSDVPAGYPEASVMPLLAAPYFPDYAPCGSFGEVFTRHIKQRVPQGATIAYVHDTHTIEDHQIMHYLGDLLEGEGYQTMYAAPGHIQWENGQALGIGHTIGGIVRYFPVEWMEFEPGVNWQGYVNGRTPAANHPMALLTQSKRLPLVWDRLGVDIPTWKMLLPTTKAPHYGTHRFFRGDYILKPAFGRVGEGINIPGAVSLEENAAIIQAARSSPSQWVAQKMFKSRPIDNMHVTLGVFAMNGEFAGLFSRISQSPRMDSEASEIPVLVERTI